MFGSHYVIVKACEISSAKLYLCLKQTARKECTERRVQNNVATVSIQHRVTLQTDNVRMAVWMDMTLS